MYIGPQKAVASKTLKTTNKDETLLNKQLTYLGWSWEETDGPVKRAIGHLDSAVLELFSSACVNVIRENINAQVTGDEESDVPQLVGLDRMDEDDTIQAIKEDLIKNLRAALLAASPVNDVFMARFFKGNKPGKETKATSSNTVKVELD